MRKLLVTSLILTVNLTKIYGQVGIGTTNPNASSALDINSSNSGLLIPRISLTSTTDVTTILNPATSVLIYNTTTVSDVVPGFYYWDTKWNLMQADKNSTDWKTTGNSIAATNFLGTTNNQDLIFKVNNSNVAKFDKNSSITLGLSSNITSGISNSVILGNQSAVSSPNSMALGYQTAVSGQYATAIGFQASTSQDYAVVLGSTSANSKIGIGTSAPDEKLHIVGNIKMTDGTQGNGNLLKSDANGKATWETLDDLASRLSTKLKKYGEIFRTSNTNLNSGNSLSFNATGPFSGVTSNTSNITVATSGDYEITYTVTFSRGSGNGNHAFQLRKNGTKIAGSTMFNTSNNSDQRTLTKSQIVTLAAGDIITAYYDSGDSITVFEGSSLSVEFIK